MAYSVVSHPLFGTRGDGSASAGELTISFLSDRMSLTLEISVRLLTEDMIRSKDVHNDDKIAFFNNFFHL